MVGDPDHPAVAHFDAATQAEIASHLTEADARTVGRHMIRGDGVSNAVYNAAANLVTAFLGGPAGLTRAIRERDPSFSGIDSRRYMLAARDVTGDNEATAAGLAALLGAAARGSAPGIAEPTWEAIREVLFLEDTAEGRHYYKGGSLNSLPITRVLSGWFERPGEPAGGGLVYVFMAELPHAGNAEPAAAGSRLQEYLEALRDRSLPVAREALAAAAEAGE